MTPESVPKRRTNVRARKFRGQLLVSINEEMFELSDSAAFIYRGINGRRSVREIGVLLAEKYAIPVDAAVGDVAELLDALARSDILEMSG
ncbi:PqqD family protein [Actinomadura sp. DC4]|uniref:PqqD family protein n=1 Tax=Actinomadura sp. DC4 TaxID=3055069 RepID=UPI0025B01BAB|nr:PqqD family protein [Actinomadura sp. DC4]MDN3358613.1 PqqD family protein [Actinomadura sp. DC4]